MEKSIAYLFLMPYMAFVWSWGNMIVGRCRGFAVAFTVPVLKIFFFLLKRGRKQGIIKSKREHRASKDTMGE